MGWIKLKRTTETPIRVAWLTIKATEATAVPEEPSGKMTVL